MMCSPYLTGSLALMLLLVTFNYWSVSTNNFDLVKEVKNMQVSGNNLMVLSGFLTSPLNLSLFIGACFRPS